MYINEKDIKQSFIPFNSYLGDGSYGLVRIVKYKGKKYARKIFFDDEHCYSEPDILRFEKLCEKYDGSNLLLPKYLTKKEELESYLMDYYKGENFSELYDRPFDEKLEFLNLAKDLIIELNKHDGLVHSDIHFGNLMFNEKYKTVALTDFDNAKVDGLETDKSMRTEKVNYFLHYNDYDKHVDIYMFNLLTFSLLNHKNLSGVRTFLNDPRYTILFTSKAAEKTLEDMINYQKNNNFLIDMVDESKINKHISKVFLK